MIKKITTALAFVLLAFGSFAQTIVSTSPENKKVILEEYTGIHCVWCPSGHAIAKAIQDANPGNVFLINVHVGSYSVPGTGEPDFRTPFGSAIAAEAGVPFYPSGSINRHVFTGSSSAMDRGLWTSKANQTLAEGSYVNVAVEADINVQTNELTVHMEGYYTGNSSQGSNLLNIALLQNNTKGPQTGGNMGNEYNHMHRLVHMVTGQWGIAIPTTTTGTFVDETFTYTIPADYNGVPVEISDLEVVAFITETHQEIASAGGCFPTFSGFANANDAYARYVEDIDDQCGFDITPSINVQNIGADEITSLDIDYSVNSGPVQTYNWTGSIVSLQSISIELPAISYSIEAVNTVNISLQNDDDITNNTSVGTFNKAVEGTNDVTMLLNSGSSGGQCTWDLINSSGTTVYSGGPYGNNESINIPMTLPGDCYNFNVYDSGANGGGSIVIFDSNSEVLYSTSGNYGAGEAAYFSTEGFLNVTSNVLENMSIYPNPTSSVLNIKNAESASIEVFNMLGQVLYTKSNISIDEQVEVSQFNTGTYFVKITSGNAVKTSKFIKL